MEKDSLTDWLQLTLTTIGGLYALFLLRQSNKEKRSQFVADILNRLYNDNEIRTIIYAVDSGRDVGEIRFGGRLEKEADKTIRYFDYIGYLIREGHLKKSDIQSFGYEINRVTNNGQIQSYIAWLRDIGVNLENLAYLTR